MPEVNQPPVIIPRQWQADPELRKFGNDLTMFLYQMWRRTSVTSSGGSGGSGGGADQIQVNKNNITALTNDVADLENGFPEYQIDTTLFQQSFLHSVISNNYQTIGNEIIKLSGDAIITLNPTPADEERVYIKSTGNYRFSVKSEKKIDDRAQRDFSRPYIGRWFSYSVELDTWSIL